MSHLEFINTGKQFNYRRVLKNLHCRFDINSRTALLGPNGAGKSTFLYLAAGIYRPSEGRVERSDLYLLSHHSMLYSGLSGRENLGFISRLSGEKVHPPYYRILDYVGLKTAADRRVDEYSRGMQQRLQIAAMIATGFLKGARFLLLDEPFTGLDTQGITLLTEIIKNGGVADFNFSFNGFIFVDHDIERALALCEDYILLNDGGIAAQGSIENSTAQAVNDTIMAGIK